MISLTDAALSVLTRSHRRYLAVESWRGGMLLASDIPVIAAGEETDRSLRVPERVTITVPRTKRGESWSPVTEDHPLAARGQQLRVKLGVGVAGGQVEWFQRGVFLIQESVPQGDTVSVAAVGLLTLIDEARFVSPFQPSGTFTSTLRDLIEPALTLAVDAALEDRDVPTAGINWDDRLTAVLELLDAWPADAAVDPAGYLRVVPAAQSTTPVLALTDGAGGTVITVPGGSSRDGAANLIVARGTGPDGAQVQGIAYDLGGGPTSYGGSFNPLPVPDIIVSQLLTSVDECTAAAEAKLAQRRRNVGREFRVEMVPHPALQAGDVVALTSERLGLSSVACSVEALSLPYLASGGSMSATLRQVA